MRHRTTDTPKGHRNYIIIACDVLLFLAMLKWLPVEPEVARGLAVLTFIGILWLTEALHVTVTSLQGVDFPLFHDAGCQFLHDRLSGGFRQDG